MNRVMRIAYPLYKHTKKYIYGFLKCQAGPSTDTLKLLKNSRVESRKERFPPVAGRIVTFALEIFMSPVSLFTA